MENEQRKQAMITALRSLTAGDKSEHELAAKLHDKGYAEENIQAVLAQLRQEGFLSDEVFAKKLSDRILRGKRAGTHKLAFELKKKHIPESIRKEVLSAVDPAEQRAQALEIAEAKILGFKDTDPRILRKKLYDFLIRKGYDFQLAQEAARTAVSNTKQRLEDENE